jgi:hypothetical protein
VDFLFKDVNPAGGQSSVNNMLHDPNLKAEGEVNEGAAQPEAPQQAEQATEGTEGAEEGTTEG